MRSPGTAGLPWRGFEPLGDSLRRYGCAVLAVLLALGLRWLLTPVLGAEAPLLAFVLAVLFAAWSGGQGPGLLATGLSALAGTWFFVPDIRSFVGMRPADLTRLAIFLVIGVSISLLTGRLSRARGWLSSGRQALVASEEKFRLLVEGVRDYAMFVIDSEGRVTSWNPGVERIKGYTADQIIGRHFSVFYPPEDVAQGRPQRHLEEAARSGVFREEGWRVRRDGSRFWAGVVLTALYGADGTLRGFAKVTRDLTERKRAEDALRGLANTLEQRVEERTAQLEEANRAMQAFAYSVSHDLRAPLRGIHGFSQALLEDYAGELDPAGQEYARRIVAAAERMDLLIHDILAYSRVSQGEIELRPVNLDQVVEEARQSVETDLRSQGGEISVEGPFPAVLAHRATLFQTVTNLLSNAVKFVAPGTAPRVRVWSEPRDGRVRLWIEDNGIGIAPEHQGRIFEVFERLHGMEIYPGTGVGLAVVRKGVEKMGGRVGVDSRPGGGSRFWVDLPRPERSE